MTMLSTDGCVIITITKKRDRKVRLTPIRSLTDHPALTRKVAMNKPTPFPLTQKEIDRFWSKVDRSGGPDACWPWMAGTSEYGYGRIRFTRNGSSPQFVASRIAYTIAHGHSIDSDVLCCHSCDNPPCCNPSHIWLGSNYDNVQDRVSKGRSGGNPSPPTAHLTARPHPNLPRGINHRLAKLNPETVKEIRQLYQPGKVGYRRLALMFGVTPMNIKAIVTGRTWKEVA